MTLFTNIPLRGVSCDTIEATEGLVSQADFASSFWPCIDPATKTLVIEGVNLGVAIYSMFLLTGLLPGAHNTACRLLVLRLVGT